MWMAQHASQIGQFRRWVRVVLPNGLRELARVASQLAEANINIGYAYASLEPGTNTAVAFFGVAEATRTAKILDQAATAGTTAIAQVNAAI